VDFLAPTSVLTTRPWLLSLIKVVSQVAIGESFLGDRCFFNGSASPLLLFYLLLLMLLSLLLLEYLHYQMTVVLL